MNPVALVVVPTFVKMRPAPAAARSIGRRAPLVLGLVAIIGVGALVGCASVPPSASPAASGVRPAIQIDQEWTAANGQWTFTGRVDPEDDPTDVVLEVGPGPSTLRRFDSQVQVVQGRMAAGPLTITTAAIPDIKDLCVRFTATNSVGASSSSPLCFPHDLPTIAPAGVPTVTIDPRWSAANGAWTFIGRVDPKGDPTDVVLEIGLASAAEFPTTVPAAQDMIEGARLEITTREIPDADEICVRFTATNSFGTASSPPLCFPRTSPGPS